MDKRKIVIIGANVSGGLAAATLAQDHPDCQVTLIHSPEAKRPLVGESLTEFSTQMLHRLGMSAYLEQDQYHKYGLTFYFKESLENPSCRRYAVHEALSKPPLPSNQINRFTFDVALRKVGVEKGVHLIEGRATDAVINSQGRHQVTVKTESGEQILEADWLIDASGRNRFLARRLNLHQDPPFQRSSFWFRLVDFDRSLLKNLVAIKPPQISFDSYFATHHFMGRGNWMWLIPMRTPDYKDMISIGIVFRPDILTKNITTLDDFLAHVDTEHPVVSELVRSGGFHDIQLMRNYHYESRQVYSKDGWYIIGDAGDTVDPLYSTGMVMTSLQVTQVSAMINLEKKDQLTEGTIRDFESAYKTVRDVIQLEISRYYEVMHDPYQAHWRMHLTSTDYFYFLLPSLLAGYLSNRFGARFVKYALESSAKGRSALLSLLPAGSIRLGKLPSDRIKNHYDRSVNWNLKMGSEEAVSESVTTLWKRLASYRMEILQNAGWTDLPTQLGHLSFEMMNHIVWKLRFAGKRLSAPEMLGNTLLPPMFEPPIQRLTPAMHSPSP